MPTTTSNGTKIIAICCSSGEVDLLLSFFSSVANQHKEINFIVLYKDVDAEEIVNKLQNKFGFQFQFDVDKWILGKSQHLLISKAHPNFVIQEEKKSKPIAHHFSLDTFEYQFDQLSVEQKVYIHFNKNLDRSIFGIVKFTASQVYFLSKNESTTLKPNLITTPATLLPVVMDKWNNNQFAKNSENISANQHVLNVFENEEHKQIQILEHNLLKSSYQNNINLNGILEIFLKGIEKHISGLHTSILWVNNNELFNYLSPSIPNKIISYIDGIEIGPKIGSCGAAAAKGKTIIVEDIRNDEKWSDFSEIFVEEGYIASWSHPIFNDKGKVIATFANYYKSVKKPTAFELKRFQRIASIIGLVLNNADKTKALNLSLERYQKVTKATYDAIWEYDVQSNSVYWGEGFAYLFGYELHNNEDRYEEWLQNIHKNDRERVIQSFEDYLNGSEEAWNSTYRFKVKNGRFAFVKDRCIVIRNNEGKAKRVFGAMQDISQQVQEEQRLRLMESVIKNTNDAVLITKAEPVSKSGPEIVYANEAFTKITGYTIDEILGKTPRILQGPKTDQNELRKLSQSLQNWEECEATLLNYKKNGEEFWIQFSISPVANEKGWYTHWIAIERDVTEQKLMELERKLLADISLIFNTNNFLDSVSQMLQKLIDFGDFTVAELWLTDVNKEYLNLRDYQYTNPRWKSFYHKKHQFRSCKAGEGLPGNVWQDKNIILWSNIESNPEVRRRKAAIQSGFNNVLGIPLIFNEQCIGVLAFGIEKIKSIHQNQDALNRIQNFLATELQRKIVEHQLEQFTSLNPDIILLLDQNGNIITTNPAIEYNLYYRKDECIGKSFYQLIHPEDQLLAKQKLEALEKQDTTRLNVRLVDNKGNNRWFDLSLISNFRDQSYYILGKDITETKKLEELLDNATNLAKIGSWEVDLNTNKVYWSPITCAIHGVDDGFEPDLENAINFYESKYRSLVKNKIEKSIQSGGSFGFEAQIRATNGRVKWVKSIGKSELRDGKCVRLFGSFQDIDAQKENEIKLKNLADNIPGVLFQYYLHSDGTDGISYISEGAKDIWQLSPEECKEDISRIWKIIENGGSLQSLKNSIQKSAETLTNWNFEWKALLPDGQIKWHSGFGVPRKISDQTIVWDSIIIDITDKRDLEDLLKRSSSAAKIGSWEISKPSKSQNNDVYLSPTLREILDLSEDAKTDTERLLNDFVIDHKDLAIAHFNQLIEEGKAFDLELLIETQQKNKKWIRTIGNTEYVGENLVKAYGSIQDITKRKQAEIQLVDSLKEKNNILESIGDGFFTVNNNWVVTYWNNKAEKILQRPKQDIIGFNLWKKYPDAVDSLFYEKYHEAKQTQQNLNFEEYYANMDIWIEASVYPTKSGLSVYFKDITQRKKTEQEIRISNERFMRVAEATSDAIWDWNINDNHIFWSEGLTKLFGHDISKFNKGVEIWGKYVHPEDYETVNASLFKAIENEDEDKWKTEYRFRKKDGKYAYVVDRGTIIRDNKKKAIRMVGSIIDISYQKEHEQSLQKLNKQLRAYTKELEISNAELEQFAYVASHDLQEPYAWSAAF